MASASASAVSAGRGGSSIRSSRITMAVTWSLPARPLPVTAAFTSLGVCIATGRPRRAAHTIATAPACAVPITVRTLCWLNTRSTATASGWCAVSHSSIPASRASSLSATSSPAGVRSTSAATSTGARPGTPSITPSPHRVSPDGAVIEVGGVGLRVQCTPDTLASLRPGEPARVATSLVVREDSLTLFGFGSEDERNVFELLQTASGIGPRLALAILAVHSPDALRRALATEDLNALTMVPGIGRKGAQRIVLELKDRLGAPGEFVGDGAAPARKAAPTWRDQVQSGLINLGWPTRDAEAAIAAVEAESDGEQPPDVATALRAALRKLSKR